MMQSKGSNQDLVNELAGVANYPQAVKLRDRNVIAPQDSEHKQLALINQEMENFMNSTGSDQDALDAVESDSPEESGASVPGKKQLRKNTVGQASIGGLPVA